jgi:serine/threonine protein kinase
VASLLAAGIEAEHFLESPPAELLVAEEVFDTDDASRTIVEDRHPQASRNNLVLEYLYPSDYPGAIGRMGPYDFVEPVGEGGMGMVYRAIDTKLNRVVALKILAPELAANGGARQRFLREAHTAAAVNHSHVVTIHAVDEAKLPYLVMEFVGGRSLQQRLDDLGPPPLSAILRIASQIASGLAAAHKEGVIHRDR